MDKENSGKARSTTTKVLLLLGACLACALTALALIRYAILPVKTWIGG